MIEPAPNVWERGLCIVLIAMLTGALIGPVFAPLQEETPVLRLVWLPAYAAIGGLILFRMNRMWRAWPGAVAIVLLIGLTFASKYWSIDPATTSRRVIALTISGAFALYLGAVFRGPHLPRLLMHAALLMAVGSLIMVFAFPAIGVHHQENAGLWRGLWYEKNQMGAVMVIGATAAAACLASPDPRRLLPAIALALSSGLVLATQSKTSLLCLMIGLGMVGGFWALRRGGPAFAVVAIWAAVVAAAAGIWIWESHSVAVLEALGKDPSLTGRTDIWDALMRKVADRPWTGYGYGAFWGREGESVPADWVRKETGWAVPSAHNGWIDLLVQLGWPGAWLVGGLIGLSGLVTVLRATGAGMREGWWSLGFLAAFFVLSLSESILLTHQSLPWVLFLAVLTRALMPSSTTEAVPLAPKRRGAYQTPPRIAAQYPYGPVRRPPFAVR
ncbi:O-antigen ligase family protein [Brevundimonas sp. Root1279]|uniref:O-antigen ligase family protein n=1 Tax=Brevundimonas sp. Root1279 TaxID=1736443 RepID=UPI0006F84404|nr:O-antigen ligase family protein [Brevundimonas sp. Root1279]KQW79658.1 polymerase [Brevundimonas sp. Root1279]